MNLIYVAIVLAIIAAGVDYFIGGIQEPWRKIVIAGIVVIFVLGLLLVLVPGVFPLRLGRVTDEAVLLLAWPAG
jgi:hypothetical protein